MEETRQELIKACEYYAENKQLLLDTCKHEDFLASYHKIMLRMTPYLWDPNFWEEIPMDVRLTHMDLHLQIVAPEDIPS